MGPSTTMVFRVSIAILYLDLENLKAPPVMEKCGWPKGADKTDQLVKVQDI